nr:MAG TPA: hypothetical protein [Caudoviricetes sp.]
MAQSASTQGRNDLHSLTILRLAPLRNTGEKKGCRWRCACIRTWLSVTTNTGSGCQLWAGRASTCCTTALSSKSTPKACQTCRLCTEGMMMNNLITSKPSMTSLEIAELVEKRHDNVKRTIEMLIVRGVITSPQIEEKPTAGRPTAVYVFESEEGKRDSIIVVAQLSPEFTARLVDRWKELEEERSRPKSQAELIAEMALLNVEQERRLYQVEEQVETVAEAVENIKRGTMRAGYVGYRQVVAKSGMTDAKCRNLVNAYRIPTDTHEFMTPDGLLSRRAIVELEPFMKAFRQMMSEAEPRGTRWYHPKMGLFQAIGWEGGHGE